MSDNDLVKKGFIKFSFSFSNNDERSELESILSAETGSRFSKSIINTICNENSNSGRIDVSVSCKEYYEDVEKAKEEMYARGEENRYMTDFISEVRENLDYVPKIDVT